ncbi:hypothetical protein MNBD_UNCLBAC01-1726 [hydrothermal vent metagenome]|uniref:Antitoxin Xre/MbcA/ParS-like toxin-binding domain-containing protein n=1 Tax=hydrothermal vent metagenome TaxID=652676 RepID=A0A3B1DGX9_9ZZZZ
MTTPITLEKILNLKKEMTSNSDLMKLTLKGLRKTSVSRVSKMLGTSEIETIRLLPISRATVARLDNKGTFDLTTSEHLVFLSKVISLGVSVLENEDNFKIWLRTPCLALGNEKPLIFLNSIFGCQSVINILGRAASGVYS